MVQSPRSTSRWKILTEDGVIQGGKTQVQSLLLNLSALLPPVGTTKTSLSINSSWTQPQLEAAYNWLFVEQ
jgi:hypothetical protein